MAFSARLVTLLLVLHDCLATRDPQVDLHSVPGNVLLQQESSTRQIQVNEGDAVDEVGPPVLNATKLISNSSAGEDTTSLVGPPVLNATKLISNSSAGEDTKSLALEEGETMNEQGLTLLDEKTLSAKKVAAEFIAMTLFVFFGCGSAMSVAKDPGWVLQVSLTFGLAITVLAYAIGHYSGGQINCAVTFGLVLTGNLGVVQGLVNFLGQMLGSVVGAALLKVAYPASKDQTGGLGTNGVSEGWSSAGALVAETVATFLLMYVVLEVAVNTVSSPLATLAPIPIGLAVFLAHSVLIPIDGCSINPTRSFGPAVVQLMSGDPSAFKDMWIFWLGPLAGAAAAAGVYSIMA